MIRALLRWWTKTRADALREEAQMNDDLSTMYRTKAAHLYEQAAALDRRKMLYDLREEERRLGI